VTPEVKAAVEEIRQTFAGHGVEVEAEAQGGAYVIVHDLVVGDHYVPTTSWFGFLITFQYPHADVYPHFIDGALARADGKPHGGGFSAPSPWRERPAIQVSRRSNRWNPATDTPAGKLLKVLEWVKSQ
jgi:hypothetical protein